MKKSIVCSGIFISMLVATVQAAVLIPLSSIWKYKSDGSNQGTAWRATAFNDAAWLSGAAELGYGDAPVTTLTSSKITYYFRKAVTISSPASYTNFTINLRRDDGIVVYVNGIEVFRNNMPTGTIAYTTVASSNCADDGNTVFTFTLPTANFIVGTNVVAAEVHNISTTSSDATFALELIGNSIALPTITRGPYIQSTSTGSTILRWKTNIASDSKVRWGTTTSYGANASDPALVTDHQIQITGLAANTKYFYSIGTISGVLQATTSNYFRTSPTVGTTPVVRIWALGDFGNGSAAQATVLNSYVTYLGTNQNNMWLWLGDNAYSSGTDAEYQSNVFNVYGNQFKSWNFYPAPGNHDYGNIGYQSAAALGTNFPYFNIFTLPTAAQAGGVASGTEKYYSYNWANIHFVALDSYGALNIVTSPMYTWLQSDLAANTQKWTIVYFHHAPYSKGTHNSDTDVELINMRQNIVPLLETFKVDLVLSGHSHTYERSYFMHGHYGVETTFASSMIVQTGDGNLNPYIKDATHNGTVYAVCGVGGEISSGTTPGYPHNAMVKSFISVTGSLALEVHGDTLQYKFLKSDGTIQDQFTMLKPNVIRFGNALLLNEDELSVYPNPNHGIFTVKTGQSGRVDLEMFDILGNLVLTDQIFDEKTMDVSNFTAGEYVLIAKSEKSVITRKVLIGN
ncbi:hypothetical protein BH11BAC2_BH11BAC2_02840 [soil metagenome]